MGARSGGDDGLQPSRQRKRDPDATRRVLEWVAHAGPAGIAEAVMLANGVSIEQMVALVRAGLATPPRRSASPPEGTRWRSPCCGSLTRDAKRLQG
jgi:hypothetical protein